MRPLRPAALRPRAPHPAAPRVLRTVRRRHRRTGVHPRRGAVAASPANPGRDLHRATGRIAPGLFLSAHALGLRAGRRGRCRGGRPAAVARPGGRSSRVPSPWARRRSWPPRRCPLASTAARLSPAHGARRGGSAADSPWRSGPPAGCSPRSCSAPAATAAAPSTSAWACRCSRIHLRSSKRSPATFSSRCGPIRGSSNTARSGWRGPMR